MSGVFATEHGTMMATAGRVDNVNQEVNGELARLRSTVETVAGSWKGQSAVAFGHLMARWNDSARRLSEALSSISDNIRANARAFEATESDNAAVFNRIGGLNL